MKLAFSYFILICLLVFSCKSFEDAKPTSRTSLIHFYGGTLSYQGVKAREDQDGGFIIIGNIQKNDFVTDLVVIKTNSLGKTMWEKVIPSSSASDIKVVDDGYLIVGDSIDYQPSASRISELVNTRARILKMTFDQTIVFDRVRKDSVLLNGNSDYSQIDFHGSALTLDNSGDIIFLGSFKSPEQGSFETSFVSGLYPTDGAFHWIQFNHLQNRDYINSKAIHLSVDNKLIWTTTTEVASQSITNAYMTVLYSRINTIPIDNPKYGENAEDYYYTGSDIHGKGDVYGVVGTFAKNDGTNANIYFVSAVANGGRVSLGKAKYFDGINATQADSTTSQYQDRGNAITTTSDGSFILAGSMQSTPTVGNGAKDVLLIKVDPFGGFLWNRLVGGTGDEEANSIIETSDGGFLVCGTNTVSNLSTIFIMKTNRDGELID